MQVRNKNDKQQLLSRIKSTRKKSVCRSSAEIDKLYKDKLRTGNYNDVEIIELEEQNRLSVLIKQDVIKLIDNYDKMTLGKLHEKQFNRFYVDLFNTFLQVKDFHLIQCCENNVPFEDTYIGVNEVFELMEYGKHKEIAIDLFFALAHTNLFLTDFIASKHGIDTWKQTDWDWYHELTFEINEIVLTKLNTIRDRLGYGEIEFNN